MVVAYSNASLSLRCGWISLNDNDVIASMVTLWLGRLIVRFYH